MKLRCPRCQQKITVEDAWAGKAIRCPGCNRAIQIPKPQESLHSLPGEEALDMESLASLEARSGGMGDEELAEAEAATVRSAPVEVGPGQRVCPHCQTRVKAKDPNVEVLCSHCGRPIPPLRQGLGYTSARDMLAGATHLRSESKVTFYEGLAGATAYPLGAIASLITAVVVAIGAILLPVTLLTAMSQTVAQSSLGSDVGVKYEKLSGLQTATTAFFILEVIFFVGVGLNAFIDVARATSIGEDKPPPLAWNPTTWGEALLGYLALLAYYALFGAIAILMAHDGTFVLPTSRKMVLDLLRSPTILTLAGVMTLLVPMNLLGLTLGKISQAVNPARLVRSILATHANYIFLFLLVTVYLSLFVALFGMVLEWFSGEFAKLQVDTALGNVGGVALALVSWGGVMGLGFYGVYVLGRLHGLFARTFHKQLEFGS